jgi:hypothetical protein
VAQHGPYRNRYAGTVGTMTDTVDAHLAAIDRFVSTIYWSDDDVTFSDAFVDAIDEWSATASAEHHDSLPFTNTEHHDPLAASLLELIGAVDGLRAGARPDLTVARALSEAVVDWQEGS